MRLLALTAATLALPTIAFAETPADAPALTVTGSLTFASRYVSDGIEYSTGAVVQPYIELGYAGFYAGIWATNAEEDLLGADSEIDYYLGYRDEAGTFYYDIGYGYYTYPDASEFNSGEVLVSGGVGLQDTVYLTAAFAYSNEFDTLDKSLRIDYYTPITGVAVAALYGNNDSWNYWSAGASYAINDTLSADATWHETDIPDVDGLFVFSLTTSF
ncbi:TorF family putative porin [Tabrizicola sp.]|uniref:TorF family putative porin n=1 Tax=Tabrizicola sp. TaxID=2005166 RepID=UPI00286BE502|nr:TorF family putative porin [Tabrizicola sp.]